MVNFTGDQSLLLCEALPGERIRLDSYVQRQSPYTIAGGMPTATVAVIDPKGDAESLVEYLSGQGRKARVLPLNSAAPGLLDPFSFGADLSEKRTMATETLRLLLPRMSEERESAMIQAVGAVAGRIGPASARSSTTLRRPTTRPGRTPAR